MITGARCAKRLRLARHSPVASSSSSVSRILHVPSPRHITFALPAYDAPHTSPTPVVDFRRSIEQQKFQDLEYAIQQDQPSYRRIWGSYVELINFVGLYSIPFDVHQKVLWACSPSPEQARLDCAKQISKGFSPFAPHPHESRFRVVIQNMKEAGHRPDLEDYHYIIRQFAAVGYHYGALRVLREIPFVGLQPTSKSFGLCMQALCHRLALPNTRKLQDKVLAEAITICNELIAQMHALHVPIAPATTDLIYRVLNRTMDLQALENLLKVAYGIDLSYPDRPPLEFWQALRSNNPAGLKTPLPFSTAALNTTIDVLGRLKNVSKLVQAFEVLTTPLPSRSATVPSSSFEDDEDDDFGVNSPAVASYPLPFAEPNTFTFETLIRHVSLASNHVLARHYLLQAMALDRQVDRRLRGDCLRLPPDQILAPKFNVNRRMLLSVFGLANRVHRMQLMRWVHSKTRRMMHRKKADIQYYSAIQSRWNVDAEARHLSTSNSSPTPSPSTSSIPDRQTGELVTPLFDLDFDAQTPREPAPKVFDINLHLKLLHRDLAQIEQLERHIADVVGRTSQRLKERLGRRVWKGKKVWLRHTGRDQLVEPSEWVEKVNFRKVRILEDGVGALNEESKKLRPRRTPGSLVRGDFFTSRTHRDLRNRR
ncbi:hypothetical protein BXZ70DRAFT_918735 [Cristinia sonorae]|uniref:Uncharacterized protein n=1 Tax=Cristinia sonorae TaxID=1940300 RepID=A0A8K0UXQ5_9AGAR|nr:hypothetical protein BXZ70DRAFT_918735 [Cristinia sonorae]